MINAKEMIKKIDESTRLHESGLDVLWVYNSNPDRFGYSWSENPPYYDTEDDPYYKEYERNIDKIYNTVEGVLNSYRKANPGLFKDSLKSEDGPHNTARLCLVLAKPMDSKEVYKRTYEIDKLLAQKGINVGGH